MLRDTSLSAELEQALGSNPGSAARLAAVWLCLSLPPFFFYLQNGRDKGPACFTGSSGGFDKRKHGTGFEGPSARPGPGTRPLAVVPTVARTRLVVTAIARGVSVGGMSRSSPETLGRRLPACRFPVVSALWHQHKSGGKDGPHFTQEDRGAVTHHGHAVSQPRLRQRPGPPLQTGAWPLPPCRLPFLLASPYTSL